MKNKVKLIKKAFIELEIIAPKCIVFTMFYGAFSSILPFINIYFSGLIVNSIIEQLGKELELIVTLVVLNFITHLLIVLFAKFKREKRTEFFNNYSARLDQKFQSIDFQDIEGQEIKNLRQQIQEMTVFSSRGIVGLVDFLETLSKDFFTIIFSVSIISTAFTTFSEETDGIYGFISSASFSVILLCFAIFSIWLSIKNNVSVQSKGIEISKEFILINKTANCYIELAFNPELGQETRIYNQNKLIIEEGMAKPFNYSILLQKKALKNENIGYFIDTIITMVLHMFIYIFVIIKATLGIFSVGNIIQYVGVISQFMQSVKGFSQSITEAFESELAFEIYFKFMEYPSKMYQGTLPVEKRILCVGGDTDYQIEFKNVSFKYPNTDNLILRNINFKFKVGGKLAIVGLNGSGKTTLIKLLTRFYDPTEGEILLNGIDIRKYDYYEYMSIFSVVFQDFKLFEFNISENVACEINYDKQRVIDCLTQSGFAEKLDELPFGIDTILGTDADKLGVNLSGGEKQKIAIARAIYKNSPFIVLDEPTAALDPVAENEIYSKFDELVGDKTAVYISHRLSSCRFCEDIVVFNQGELVERGNHDNLIEKAGLYHEMWYAQAKYYN